MFYDFYALSKFGKIKTENLSAGNFFNIYEDMGFSNAIISV